jgi:peptidoglycan/LPS O-acetylase OafA/YrhL
MPRVRRLGLGNGVRIKRIDVLRCIAVVLVLLHHGAYFSVFKMGFVGVDLFFVLSGFLISGLLYSEYQKSGAINFRRFFIRRGLKIYPAFYVMILATFIVQFSAGKLSHWSAYASEIFFLQDYKPSIWLHCWSLGVEEKFYIFLPLFLLVLIRYSANRSNPFNTIPRAFVLISILCLTVRAATIWLTPPSQFYGDTIMMPAHDRIDELFFGVLLGYFHYFHRLATEDFMRSTANRLVVGVLTVVFLSTCFIFPGTGHFFLIFGPTFLYLGFGGLLMLCIHVRDVLPTSFAGPLDRLSTTCAFVGLYSYSIYLWQGVFGIYTERGLRQFFHVQMQGFARFTWYVVGCIIFGILMARLIEFPVLKLRDTFFPSPQLLPAAPGIAVVTGVELPAGCGEVLLPEPFVRSLKAEEGKRTGLT